MSTAEDQTLSEVLGAAPGATSESEEMFLITVARAVEDGHPAPVSVPLVADTLSISRVSANEMTKKLVGRGFVEYEPYHGVTLTTEGTAIANRVLRRRRLWALFLAKHLGLSPEAADTVACEFEHVTPADVAGRLAEFLGDPTLDPGGKPIPAAGSTVATGPNELALADLTVGRKSTVTRIAGDSALRSFLEDEGLTEGTVVTLLAIGSDHGCLVDTTHGHVHLSAEVAALVLVSPGAE
jgi:DtxR family Mn-dependent transcriptional regulator